MPKIDDGGPAFPAIIPVEHSEVQGKDYPNFDVAGMTLRDYFAAQALQGLCFRVFTANINNTGTHAAFAEVAYAFADAMLAERSKHK